MNTLHVMFNQKMEQSYGQSETFGGGRQSKPNFAPGWGYRSAATLFIAKHGWINLLLLALEFLSERRGTETERRAETSIFSVMENG